MEGDLPGSVVEGVPTPGVDAELVDLADNPRWVFSKSFRTRSRAASTARFFSSSASAFIAANLAFCFLISRLCVTSKFQYWRYARHPRTHEDKKRTQVCENAFGTEQMAFAAG